jgi:hypothetical protein
VSTISAFGSASVIPHDHTDSATLYFKAPPLAQAASVGLVKASILSWNANFSYILTQKTGDNPPTPPNPEAFSPLPSNNNDLRDLGFSDGLMGKAAYLGVFDASTSPANK